MEDRVKRREEMSRAVKAGMQKFREVVRANAAALGN